MSAPDFWLAAVVAVAFVVEAALGFGATLVTVSLAALFLPIPTLLAAFVPVNVVLSLVLTVRERAHIDRALLFKSVLPWMLAGLPVGMLAVRTLDHRSMKIVFGVFVAVLSLIELAGDYLRKTELRPMSAPARVAMLLLGGAVHGAFSTGGPMAVYVVGRSGTNKSSFRATLCALWIGLNTFLVAGFVYDGSIGLESAKRSALLFPSLAIGLVLGEALHRRISLPVFRVLVFVLLTIVGITLALRA